MTRRGPKSDFHHGLKEVHQGAAISPDAVEFGRAMETYMRMMRTRNPSCGEILKVVKSLGYTKDEA